MGDRLNRPTSLGPDTLWSAGISNANDAEEASHPRGRRCAIRQDRDIKAGDVGYRLIILLTGTLESLRRQTQERLDEGFVGLDSIRCTEW